MEESQEEEEDWAAIVPRKTKSIASKKGIMEEEVILTLRIKGSPSTEDKGFIIQEVGLEGAKVKRSEKTMGLNTC